MIVTRDLGLIIMTMAEYVKVILLQTECKVWVKPPFPMVDIKWEFSLLTNMMEKSFWQTLMAQGIGSFMYREEKKGKMYSLNEG